MKRNRTAAQFAADRQRVGWQGRFQCYRAIEPREEQIGIIGVERRFLDFDQLTAGEFEDRPFPAVRSNANEMLAFFTLPVGEIIGHPTFDVAPFFVQVALGLKNGATDQGVDASFDLGDPLLEIQLREGGAEFDDQQLAKICLDLIVAGFAVKMPEQRKCFGFIGQTLPQKLAHAIDPSMHLAHPSHLQPRYASSSPPAPQTLLGLPGSLASAARVAKHRPNPWRRGSCLSSV